MFHSRTVKNMNCLSPVTVQVHPACADLVAVRQNAECICDVRSVRVHGGYKLYLRLSSLVDKSNYDRATRDALFNRSLCYGALLVKQT